MKVKKLLAILLMFGIMMTIMSACVKKDKPIDTDSELQLDTEKGSDTIRSEDDSETSEDDAETSQDDSETQEDDSETSEDDSETSGDTTDDTSPDDTRITIACIGDSITEGVGVDEKAKYSYPARLAEALGEGYEVLNYGKSGATMCGSSAGHYKAKNWFTYSGKYEEMKTRSKDIDVVFIMLGTNDGNSSNALISDLFTEENVNAFKADYEANLKQMVNDLRAGNKNVKIYLMNSPKCYRTGNTWEQTLTEVLRPMQAKLAKELDLTLYDMYTFSSEVMGNRNFPDNLHPGMNGYYLMGQELAKVVATIYGTETNKGVPPMSSVNYEETFDTVANGTSYSNKDGTATDRLGGSNVKIKVLENSTLTVNNGVLALTRSATTTDAYFEVLLDKGIFNGKHTFEMSIKTSENFDSRGAIFYMFGHTFVQYNVYGNIMNKAGKKLGDLSSTEFVTIAVTVDCDNETYVTYINGEEVDNGSFVMKEATAFRPLQIYATGGSTVYVDYIKAYTGPNTSQKPEGSTPPIENPPSTDDTTNTKITIACIGDSITEGVGVDEKDKYSYPARLAEALGEGYEVLNYGKSGATMCGSSATLYPSKNWFTYSGKYDEMKRRAKDIDVVFIMLGTNDGNSSNTNISDLMTNNVNTFKADYEANLTQMVNDLRAGNANVKIYLMTSPKCYRTGNTWEQTLTDIVRPLQRELAEKLSLEIYDMYTFSSEVMGNRNFPDNLHAGMNGYYLMGQELAKVVAEIYGTETNKGVPPMSSVNYEETFNTVPNGTVLTNQNSTTVELGNSNMTVKVLDSSKLAVNDGVLALTRSSTVATSDAYFEVLLDKSIFNGKHTFEISLKACENFDSRGAIFYMFGHTFVQYNAYGNIMNKAGKKLGDLSSTEFITIAVTVDCDNETYVTYINGEEVDNGSFVMKEAAKFRPLQIYGTGGSTLYVDYIKAYTVTE